MAEDERVEILIKAIDEMSGVLKNIQTNVEGLSKNTEKSTESLSGSFKSTTTSLLAMGNAASSVDNIFSSYQNLQIRVENAQERVENATDRLADAQYNLNKITKKGATTAEEYKKAQDEVTRAQRSLTIAQNNQQRINGQIIGTYINMTVQSISLVQSLSKMGTVVNELRLSYLAFEASLGPVGWALIGVTAAVAGIAIVMHNTADEADSMNEVMGRFAEAQSMIKDETELANEKLTAQSDAIRKISDEMNKMIVGVLPGEGAALEAIAKQRDKLQQAREDEANHIKSTTGHSSSYESAQLKKLQEEYEIHYTQRREVLAAYAIAEQTTAEELTTKLLTTYEERKKIIQQKSPEVIAEINKEYDAIDKRNAKAIEDTTRLILLLANLENERYTTQVKTGSGVGGTGTTQGYMPPNMNNKIDYTIKDGIVKPDGTVIKTDPRDTLVALKNPSMSMNESVMEAPTSNNSNVTLVIRGNVYGTDPDEIAQAMFKKLRRKIAL